MKGYGLTRDEAALVTDLRRALSVATSAFVDSVAAGDLEAADRWAAIAFGIVRLTQGERADA